MFYYFYKNFRKKSLKFLPKSAWLLLAFLVLSSLSLLINFEYLPDPKESFEELRHYFLGFFGIFIFHDWMKRSSVQEKRILIWIYIITVILSSLYSLYLFIETGERVGGFLTRHHFNHYAHSLALVIPLIVAAIAYGKEFTLISRPVLILALEFSTFGLLLTQSRGPILAVVISVSSIFFLKYKKIR